MDNRVKDFFLFKESTSGLYYLCLRFVRFPFLIISRSDPRWHCFTQIQSRLERNESAKQNCRIVAFIRLCCLKHWLMIWLRSYKCSHHSSPEPIRKPQEWRHNSWEKTKSKTYFKTLVCSFVFEMRHPTNKFDERTMVDYNNLLITFQTTWSPQLCLAQWGNLLIIRLIDPDISIAMFVYNVNQVFVRLLYSGESTDQKTALATPSRPNISTPSMTTTSLIEEAQQKTRKKKL